MTKVSFHYGKTKGVVHQGDQCQFERIRPISRWKAKAGSKYNLRKKLCLIKVGLGSKSLKVVTSVN